MATAASIALAITGKDQTAQAFADVAKRAKATMGGLKKALAFAGAGLGVAGIARAAKSAIDELGTLSDQAQRVGTSAVYLQQLTGALDKIGVVGVNVDALAVAFGKMAKETGRTGAAGFEATLAGVARLGTEQERVTELTRVFGRQMGATFAPLVRQGPDALREGLAGVMAMMPAVSDAAVNAGDSAADALKIAGNTIKAGWQQTVGDMVAGWQGTFGVSFEESLYRIVEYAKWFAKSAWSHFRAFGENVGKLAGAMVADFSGGLEWIGRGFAGVLNGIGRMAREFGAQLWGWLTGEGRMDWSAVWQSAVDGFEAVGKSAFGEGLEWSVVDDAALAKARDAAIGIKVAGIEAQAKLASGVADAEGGVAEAATKASDKVRKAAAEANKLVFAGTYDAMRLAAGGGIGGAAGGVRQGSGTGRAGGAGNGAAGDTGELRRLLRELISVQRESLAVAKALGVA